MIKAAPKVIPHSKSVNIDLSQVIGQEFNTHFMVTDRQKGTLSLITEPQSNLTREFFVGAEDDSDEEEKDNRNIIASTDNQRLTCEQVEAMKESKSGKEIINALINNSDSWNQRTKFSQAKWLKKKE